MSRPFSSRRAEMVAAYIDGDFIAEIAKRFGISKTAVYAALADAGVHTRGNASREGLQQKQRFAARVAERRREIPDDTRSLTARFCGDPLPTRSALDQRESNR